METRRLPRGFAGSPDRFAAAARADSAAEVAFMGVTIASNFSVRCSLAIGVAGSPQTHTRTILF